MHPLNVFEYCPRCGSNQFVIRNEKSKRCQSCDFQFYINPAAAVAAFIVNDQGELLVCRRAHDPAKGTYDLPGGFADLNESIEESLIREIKEELWIDIDNYDYLFSLPNEYYYSGFNVHTMDLFFQVKVSSISDIQAHDDVLSAEFIPLHRINPDEFGLASVSKAVRRWLDDQLY